MTGADGKRDLSAVAQNRHFQNTMKTLFSEPNKLRVQSLPADFLPELAVTTCEKYFESDNAITTVAREWAGWGATGADPQAAPLVYLQDEKRFRLRWPRDPAAIPSSVLGSDTGGGSLRPAVARDEDASSMDALTALSVVITDAGTLLNGVAAVLGERKLAEEYDTFHSWFARAEQLVNTAYHQPRDLMDNGPTFKAQLLEALRDHGAWQVPSPPFIAPNIPKASYWWLGAWLLSHEARTCHVMDRTENAAEIVTLFAVAKLALRRPGRRRVRALRPPTASDLPAFKPILRHLRCESVPVAAGRRKLAWLQPDLRREVDMLQTCLMSALAEPMLAKHLSEESVSGWLFEKFGVSQAVGTVMRTDVVEEHTSSAYPSTAADSSRAGTTEAEAAPVPATAPAVWSALPSSPADAGLPYLRPSRPAALMWASGASNWHGRGQAAAEHVLHRIRRSRPPTREQAEDHLRARLEAAIEVGPIMSGYLRHAFWFAMSTVLMAFGAGGACALMTAHAQPLSGLSAVEHLGAIVPLLGVLLANVSWSGARGVPSGLTVWGWTLCGVSGTPGLLEGQQVWWAASALPLGMAFAVLLRLPSLRSRQDSVAFGATVTASKLLNLMLEQREAPLSTDLETVPLPAALALPVEVVVRLYPDLESLAMTVRDAEYKAYARYGRYAPILAYTRLARQPMAHYLLVHRGDEGVRIRGFARHGAYR